MLAYVFWHWSAAKISQAVYEDRLQAFHRTLAMAAPEGFIRSAAFRIQGARWLQQPNAYEDWYLVKDFAALGTLNAAAVSGARKFPHDEAARLASGGIAGLYRLVAGLADFRSFRFAVWLAKPSKTSYEQFLEQAQSWIQADQAALWQRQMTLGPTTEFCLQSTTRIEVEKRYTPVEVPLVPVTHVAERRISDRKGRI